MRKLILKQRNGTVRLKTETGECLPGQVSVQLESRPEDIVKITVVFVVGEDVVLEGPLPEND